MNTYTLNCISCKHYRIDYGCILNDECEHASKHELKNDPNIPITITDELANKIKEQNENKKK
jgi:hypothetical protein